MLRDSGSWDFDFNRITARIRERFLQIVHATGTHVCVPLQGSGTFAIEAAIGSLVLRGGHVLVPQNGAYCERIARICRILGRKLTTLDYAENAAVRPEDIDRALASDPTNYVVDSWAVARTLSAEGLAERERASKEKLIQESGAHYVVDDLRDLPPVIAEINQRLADGENPD
jgi:aspartate aminotransferase-like enzyme